MRVDYGRDQWTRTNEMLSDDEERVVNALEDCVGRVKDKVRNDEYALWFIFVLVVLFLALAKS